MSIVYHNSLRKTIARIYVNEILFEIGIVWNGELWYNTL